MNGILYDELRMQPPKRRKGYVKRAFAGAIVFVALVWSTDWLILSRKSDAYGQVEVRRSYSVHLKGRKIEQDRGKPEPEECVHSLFSHYGDSPCWYLERHKNDTQELDGGPWHFWAQ